MYLQGLNEQLDEQFHSRINTKEIEKWNTKKGDGRQQKTNGYDRFAVKVDAIAVTALAVTKQTPTGLRSLNETCRKA